jgi:YggT family protein
MSDSLTRAGIFLISTAFNLYILILVLRLLLAFARANYFNPLTQFIIKVTQPLVAPLRRIIPNYRGIEFSTLVLIILFETIKIALLSTLYVGSPEIATVFLLAFLDTIKIILNTFFYAILLQALLSWFQPGYSPAGQVLQQITSPILTPVKRLLPPINGIDFSPIPAMILLQLLIIMLP